MQRILTIVLAFCLLVPSLSLAQASPLNVIATTTLIADVAQNVGGDLVTVTALMPPGADAHAFVPDPRDVAMVADADVVLVNGANLEESLLDVVTNAAAVDVTVVSTGVDMLAFGAGQAHDEHEMEAEHDHADEGEEHASGEILGKLGIDLDCGADDSHEAEDEGEDEHEHGPCDPHVWGNPLNVAVWAENIADALAAADPVNAETYRANATAYREQLTALDAELETLLADIPQAQRVLVTNHEFLGYFSARYDFELIGTVMPGGSTLAEPAPADIAALIDLIRDEGVPAIFAEVSDSSTLAEVIAGDVGQSVAVVTLYSGSLSAADGPAATYQDYMRYNAQAIANALGS
jgi:zinc/manganese transport system substrate-binding protein